MRRNPDDASLLSRLTVEVDDDPRAMRGKVDHYVEFRVFDGKEYAAVATFRVMRKYAEAVDVQVTQKYRRKGVASWLYRWVENKTGLIVKHSKDQTLDGRAFAKGRRGNPSQDLEIASKSLKSVIDSEEAYEILDEFDGNEWTGGSCYPLAFAIKRWLGRGQIVNVVDARGRSQHVAVEADGLYLDGDGITSSGEFIDLWRRDLKAQYGEGVLPIRIEPAMFRPAPDAPRSIRTARWPTRRAGKRLGLTTGRAFSDRIYELLRKRIPLGHTAPTEE